MQLRHVIHRVSSISIVIGILNSIKAILIDADAVHFIN
jgi:hypothetical protein